MVINVTITRCGPWLKKTCCNKIWTYEIDKSEYKNHAVNASKAFADYAEQVMDYKPHFLLLNAISSHMGQWSTEKEDRPFTSVDRCVHLADYIASRPFIDIPIITDEWDREQEIHLPF